MKIKIISFLISVLVVLALSSCGNAVQTQPDDISQNDSTSTLIVLNKDSATIDGEAIQEFDYTWNIDPSKEKEWYEGDEPETDACAYIAHDIWYYPELDEDGFTLQNYDGENEWVYHYTAQGLSDYIFSTLPSLGEQLPTQMMHSAQSAYNNPVLHITKPGTYTLEGEWNGQIFVDLEGEDEVFTDENAKVTIILNGVDVTCDVAPAFIAYNAFECDNTWEDSDEHTNTVDTTDAGVCVVIADGTVNNFTGANVYRLLKAEYKSGSDSVQKKSHKIDGAFYSFVSMNIEGQENQSGILNIHSTTFEGLSCDLHLTINGGNINIYSQDDGINTSEDDVSVFTLNDGRLHIFAGLGSEGDVIDSNGYIVINGGLIAGGTPSGSDSILDSDCGTEENGGEVINVGSSNNMGGGMKPGEGTPGDMPNNGENPPQMPNGDETQGQFPQGNPPQMPPNSTTQGGQNNINNGQESTT